MSKSIGVTDEIYQYVKGYADANGMSLREATSEMVGAFRDGQRVRIESGERKLTNEEIDAAMAYERKEKEVTARDGLAALFAISRGAYKEDIGRDRS